MAVAPQNAASGGDRQFPDHAPVGDGLKVTMRLHLVRIQQSCTDAVAQHVANEGDQ